MDTRNGLESRWKKNAISQQFVMSKPFAVWECVRVVYIPIQLCLSVCSTTIYYDIYDYVATTIEE